MKGINKEVKGYQGIIIFVITMLAMWLIASPVQLKFGMIGLALTELLLLIIGLIPIFIMKIDIKKVLPVKKPKVLEVLGVVIIWVGTFIIVTTTTLVTSYFFPEMLEVATGMSDFFNTVPLLISVLIVAVMPAICEEVLHRGIILYTFKEVKYEKLVIFVMALIFGVFHMSVFRFLPTAILGFALTYIMVKSKNILLPMLLHFINNLLSVLVSSIAQPDVAANESLGLLAIGVWIIIASGAPLIVWIGKTLLKGQFKENFKNKKSLIIQGISVVVIGVVLFGTGIIIMVTQSTDFMVLNSNHHMDVTDETEDLEIPFEIASKGKYMMNFAMTNEHGISEVFVLSDSDEVIMETSAHEFTMNRLIDLEQGDYKVVITFHNNPEDVFYKERDNASEEMMKDIGFDEDYDQDSEFDLTVMVMKQGL